ncbi:glycosyltransferase family 4 protein [Pseudomonadota bacterium]
MQHSKLKNASVNQRYLVVLGHFGHMGGAERQAFHLIQYLRRERDAKVAVLGWYGTEGQLADTLRDWGCEIFRFPYKEVARPTAKALNLLRLAWFIRSQIRPECILPFVAVHSKPICQIWRLTGARYAWWNQQDEGRWLYGTRAERHALLNAVHITSNSNAGSDFISRTYDIPAERILTYNNGTVLPVLSSIKPIWRDQLSITQETPLVCMVANVTPFKDYETLLKAWRIVLNRYISESKPAPILAIAGHLREKAHVNKLKVFAFDLELGPSVKFLGSIDSTNELMWESNLVVHSSINEGCPNSVCEAMALGKPVVATNIPGTRQAIGKSIWAECLSAPQDAKELANQILKFLSDQALAANVGALNRQQIKDNFSISRMCSFFMSLLDKTQTQRSGRSDRS